MSLFIIEGIDGSGKSTQLALLEQKLAAAGYRTRKLKFPNYEDRSSGPVQMYLQGEFGQDPDDVNAYAASSFYAVDRYASFKKSWEKDYLDGTVILSDRYVLSNVIHQGSKLDAALRPAFCEWLYDFEYRKLQIPVPDLTFYLDVPPEIANLQLEHRYQGDENKKDIHEKNKAYMNRCYQAGIAACALPDVKRVDCVRGGRLIGASEINSVLFAEMLQFLKR